MKIELKILGTPQPKQSARFRVQKFGNKSFVKSYQKKEVVENERNFAYDAKSQLPENFKPFSGPLKVSVVYIFPVLKSFPRWKLNLINQGIKIHKETKPDLTDNLNKGVFDALEGIVYLNDSQICKIEAEKIYGNQPRIDFIFEELKSANE